MKMMKMLYEKKHFQDPYLLFERRTQLIRSRLQVLLNDYMHVQHYVSKAIIIDEIERLVDDLIERELVLSKQRENREH